MAGDTDARKKPGRGLGAVDEPAVDVDEVEPGSDPALRALRKQLLYDTLRPYRGRLAAGAAAVVASTAAVLSIPVLVKLGIDHGVTPRHSGTLMQCVAVLLVAIVVDFGCQQVAQRIAGQVAEQSLYDLRMRLWRHMQGLSL